MSFYFGEHKKNLKRVQLLPDKFRTPELDSQVRAFIVAQIDGDAEFQQFMLREYHRESNQGVYAYTRLVLDGSYKMIRGIRSVLWYRDKGRCYECYGCIPCIKLGKHYRQLFHHINSDDIVFNDHVRRTAELGRDLFPGYFQDTTCDNCRKPISLGFAVGWEGIEKLGLLRIHREFISDGTVKDGNVAFFCRCFSSSKSYSA